MCDAYKKNVQKNILSLCQKKKNENRSVGEIMKQLDENIKEDPQNISGTILFHDNKSNPCYKRHKFYMTASIHIS